MADKPKGPKSGLPAQPGDGWNKEPPNAAAAIAQCEALIDMIDDDVPDKAKDKAGEFFDDVRDKVVSMSETLTATGRCSEKQQQALDNWQAAVSKWIR